MIGTIVTVSGLEKKVTKIFYNFYRRDTLLWSLKVNFVLAGPLEYLDRLPDAPAFSLPTTEKRRSGENSKTLEYLNGKKISPQRKVKRRKRVIESTTTSEDSELNEALNHANNNATKKNFLVDEQPGPSKHISPIRKKKTKPVLEIDFSGEKN